MSPTSDLERECRSYTRYLAGQTPSRYIIEKYLDFHQKIGFQGESDRFDRFLLKVSARGAFAARLADTYASVWNKKSPLRKKIVLTLALLECSPPTCEMLDRVPAGGTLVAGLRLAAAGICYAGCLLLATALFAPIRLWGQFKGR